MQSDNHKGWELLQAYNNGEYVEITLRKPSFGYEYGEEPYSAQVGDIFEVKRVAEKIVKYTPVDGK